MSDIDPVRARISRLKDALLFKIADVPHSELCAIFAVEQAPCDCWRKEALEAIDEAKDADLCTELRDLRDENEELKARFISTVEQLQAALNGLIKIRDNGTEHGGTCEHDCSVLAVNAIEEIE